jgi:benzoyl-CoA oxygenase/reductase BoxA protein
METFQQHVIDPVICIRCNTCEDTCPVGAVTHDSRNYVVDPEICNGCGACISPCPTGSIDNWRAVLRSNPYSLDAQFSWDELPPEQEDLAANATELGGEASEQVAIQAVDTARGAAVPPVSAVTPATNLYGVKRPAEATVVGNYRLTGVETDNDVRHIVLDFGSLPFPVLEGQSIGIIPPGTDASGRPHHARQYSIASPRNGERPGYNNLSLTVKRVAAGHDGNTVDGVCSNYLCDLEKGATVKVIGPFGATFLMPDDPLSPLLMICTGTGSAPMRAMTERRRRLRHASDRDRLMLFFGARTPEELPYFGPLKKLPADFIDVNLAFSRVPDAPKRYVQDLMRERISDVAQMLADPGTHIYVCGLRGMEDGVLDALAAAAEAAALDWPSLHAELKREGRIHFETY